MSGGISWSTAPMRRVLARWDAVTVHWGLDGDERSALLGGCVAGPVDDVSSYGLPGAERRMRLLVELDLVLGQVFGDEAQICSWLRRPNQNLGGRRPLDVMAQSPDWIRWLIDALGIAA